MDFRITEVTTRAELKKFISFPYQLYRGNRFFVPPPLGDEYKSLQRDKNPAFDFCDAAYWLAERDGAVVGRIACIVNKKFNELWNERSARFGWFDFVDDPAVCAALLATAEQWARDRGLASMHGPLGFTDMDGEGTLIEGFEELSTLGSIYNYPYYAGHIEQAGYAKAADWVEYNVTIHKEIPDQVRRVAEIALQRNRLKVFEARKAKDLLPYAKEIFQVLNDAYKDLYGFVALSEKQIDMYVKQYFGFIVPDYCPLVLDASGRVAAFGIAMPSLSRAFQQCNGRLFPFGFISVLKALRKTNAIDLYLTAVRPDLQNKGVNAILIYEMNKALLRNGITSVETNRELEGNAKIQAQWRFYDSRQHKRRRCYRKDLNSHK